MCFDMFDRQSGAVRVSGEGGGFLVSGDEGGAVRDRGECGGGILDGCNNNGDGGGFLSNGDNGGLLNVGDNGGNPDVVMVVLNGTFRKRFNFVSFIINFPASDSTILRPPCIAV